MLKNQKGITLVALVVTIVVLIILATISISVAIQTGITDKAQAAQTAYQQKETEWAAHDANITAYLQKQLDEVNK